MSQISRRELLARGLGVVALASAAEVGCSDETTTGDLDGKATDPVTSTRASGRRDVRSFGVSADGSDDATALQAAFDSGARLVIPKDVTVSVGEQLEVPSGLDLLLDGRIERIWNGGGSGGLGAMFIQAGSASARQEKVKITGQGSVGAASHTVGSGFIFYLGVDDLLIEGITVDTYWQGLAFLVFGDRIRMDGVRVVNSEVAAGTGGIRMCGGDDFVATHCHVESGDDALQFVPAETRSGLAIRNGTYADCTGFSTAGRFMAVGTGGTTSSSIDECSFVRCHGKASRRGVVVQVVENATGSVRRISLRDCSVDMSNDTQNDAAGAVSVHNTSSAAGAVLREVAFDNVAILNPSSGAIRVQRADAVSFNNCRLEPDRIGSPHFVQVRDDVNDFTLTNSQILGTGTKTVISVSATSTGTLIEGNEITAIGDGAISAIEVLGGLDTRVRGNRFRNAAGGGHVVNGIRVAREAIGTSIEDNDLSALAATDRVSIAPGAAVTLRDNRGTDTQSGPP